jgi:uncharacterized membrane protein YpjA
MDRSSPIPRSLAQEYLLVGSNLVTLLGINGLAFLVGIRFYVTQMVAVPTALWPLFADSPAAIFLAMLALAALLPAVGARLDAVPVSLPMVYLQTLAFVWLVKTGLWTVVALNLGFDQYFPAVWDYFGIILTHLVFLVEAYLLVHVGRTTRGALALALVVALVNDVVDYGFGFHPPLRYEPGVVLPIASVSLSLIAVALAARAFPKQSATVMEQSKTVQ